MGGRGMGTGALRSGGGSLLSSPFDIVFSVASRYAASIFVSIFRGRIPSLSSTPCVSSSRLRAGYRNVFTRENIFQGSPQ